MTDDNDADNKNLSNGYMGVKRDLKFTSRTHQMFSVTFSHTQLRKCSLNLKSQGMARRSDFAQKLLDDLRLRKERLAAAQSSGNAHARADGNAKSRQTIRGSTNGKGSMKYLLPTQNQATGRQKPPEPSNQIIPFTGGQGTKHMGDFSLALAFAVENWGKLRMTDLSRNQNPMLSFLRGMGRGSMDVGERRSLTVQVPPLSQLHVKEISKGAENLNQILRAWSNGLNFDGGSVQIGKELLKGANDLQESLRMLASMQGGSLDFSTGPRQKNRIVLLEDSEDDGASIVKSNSGNKIKRIEPPRFSFDKPASRDHGIRQSTVAFMNRGLPALTYQNESSSGLPSNPVKERKTNVIVKLMGLEELPTNNAAAFNFHEGVATLKPNSPPWPIPPSIQVERANKSPLSQEISRMKMGSERKVTAPEIGAAEVESIKRLYSKKPEKSKSARSDPKTDDSQLKEQRIVDKLIHTHKHQKHEQGITRNPDRRVPKDRKSTGTIETASKPYRKRVTGQKLQGKGGKDEGKQRVDEKNRSPLQDNSQRRRGNAKHVDGSAFLPKPYENSFRYENINKKKVSVGGNGPENRLPAEFADMGRNKDYEDMKMERIPAQRGGAPVVRATERKEIPAQVLCRAKVTEHLETEKFKVMKEAANKKGGFGEGVLRLPLPRSSHTDRLQRINREKILDVSGNIKLPQTDGGRGAGSISAIQEEDEHRNTGTSNEKMRYQELSKVTNNPVSDQRDPVMSPLHITVEQSQEALFQTHYREFGCAKLNSNQHTDRNSPNRGILRTQIQETLTEPENRLKQVLLRSRLFVDTVETFFDFSVPPPQTIPYREDVLTKTDDGLVLDCGYEIAKRKGRLQELALHPLVKMTGSFPKVATLEDLIKQLRDCFERLTSHGRNGNPSCEVEEYVPRMFEADMKVGDPETNCMWDLGWNSRAFAFIERDEVVRNVEKMVIGGLVDEIARDLFQAA